MKMIFLFTHSVICYLVLIILVPLALNLTVRDAAVLTAASPHTPLPQKHTVK